MSLTVRWKIAGFMQRVVFIISRMNYVVLINHSFFTDFIIERDVKCAIHRNNYWRLTIAYGSGLLLVS